MAATRARQATGEEAGPVAQTKAAPQARKAPARKTPGNAAAKAATGEPWPPGGTQEPPAEAGRPDPAVLRRHPEAVSSPAASWRQTSTGPAASTTQEPLATRLRDRLLWLWPVVALAGLAVASNYFAIVGVLTFGTATTGALLLYTGANTFRRRFHIAVGAIALASLTAVFSCYAAGILDDGTAGQAAPAGTDARRAVVAGANLSRQTFVRADLPGVTAAGVHLEDAVLDRANLAGADLRGGHLHDVHLHGADLRGAILRGADLGGADLTKACLVGADLTGAVLAGADATGAAEQGATISAAQVKAAEQWPPPGSTDAAACQ
jgi:pentapeptide repeat protein